MTFFGSLRSPFAFRKKGLGKEGLRLTHFLYRKYATEYNTAPNDPSPPNPLFPKGRGGTFFP
jgi:hypothetical protein